METGDEIATACFIVCSLFVKNAAFCERLRLNTFISPTKMTIFLIMPEKLQNEQSSCLFSRDNKYKTLGVCATKTL